MRLCAPVKHSLFTWIQTDIEKRAVTRWRRQQPAEDLEKEKRLGGSSGWPGEEAREPAYCIRCGVGFLVAILLDIDRETHEYSLIRRGCVRRRSPLVSLRASFYVYMCEYTRTRVPNPPTLSNSVQTYVHTYKRAHNLHSGNHVIGMYNANMRARESLRVRHREKHSYTLRPRRGDPGRVGWKSLLVFS